MPTIDTIQNVATKLGKKYGVNRLYLFGSYARGTANENSDVDIRIDRGDVKTLVKLAGLHLDLEETLGINVDLIPTDSLDDKFLNDIQSEEILLYDK